MISALNSAPLSMVPGLDCRPARTPGNRPPPAETIHGDADRYGQRADLRQGKALTAFQQGWQPWLEEAGGRFVSSAGAVTLLTGVLRGRLSCGQSASGESLVAWGATAELRAAEVPASAPAHRAKAAFRVPRRETSCAEVLRVSTGRARDCSCA